MRPGRALALTLAALLLTAPAAWADGDPASDVLLSDDVFFPYAPATAKPLQTALVEVLKRARAAGYPMKVALIESAGDLGAYPQMFNQPQAYANLLAGELPGNPHGGTRTRQHLLVVMPAGFGGDNLGDRIDEALAPVRVDPAAQSDGLARAAIHAVARIATLNGHAVPVPKEASAPLPARNQSTKRSSGASPVVFVAPVLLVLLGAALAGRIATKRGRPPEAEPAEPEPVEPASKQP
jgi:GNAT superfamily N-acetyltransferase